MTFATVSVSASGLLDSFSCGAVEGSQRRFRISLWKWRYEVPGSALYKIMPPGSDVVTGRTG